MSVGEYNAIVSRLRCPTSVSVPAREPELPFDQWPDTESRWRALRDWFPVISQDGMMVVLEQTLAYLNHCWRHSANYRWTWRLPAWIDHCALPMGENTVGRVRNPAATSRRPPTPAGTGADALLKSGTSPLPQQDVPGTIRFDLVERRRVIFNGFTWVPVDQMRWERHTPDEIIEDTVALWHLCRTGGLTHADSILTHWAQHYLNALDRALAEPPHTLCQPLWVYSCAVNLISSAWREAWRGAGTTASPKIHREYVALLGHVLDTAAQLTAPVFRWPVWWARCTSALPIRDVEAATFDML